MSDVFDYTYPKRGLFDDKGNLSKSGIDYLAGVGRSTEPRAKTAAGVMGGGNSVIQSRGLWATMNGVISEGAELYRPDLLAGLDHDFLMTGAVQVGPPQNIPGVSRPFFSVMFIQDATGGRPLSFTDALEGEPPIIFEGANDKTLCGFKVVSRNPDRFLAYTIKGIVAAA